MNVYDIYSLLKDLIVMLNGEVNDLSANLVVAQMLFLELKIVQRILTLYRTVWRCSNWFRYHDTMQFIKSVSTIVMYKHVAWVVLLWQESLGKRFVLPNSYNDPPSGGAGGQATDMQIKLKK